MGVLRLVLLAALVALNGWLLSGAVGPLRDLPEPDWVLVLRPAWHLAIWWLGSAAALIAAHAAIATRVYREPSLKAAFAPSRVGPWAPILLLALPPLAVFLLAAPLRAASPPWLYLFVDLRWWLIGGVAVLVAREFDAAAGRPIAARVLAWFRAAHVRSRGALWLELGLVALLAILSLATSPRLRFQSAILGDEPKYLRYLENWYRGRGFDIVGLVPIGELPPNQGSKVLGNLRQVTDALSLVAKDLIADARRMAGLDAPPRPGPARSEGGWFVEGKRGGVFQVHGPGFSLLLFPGYFADRSVLNWTSNALSPQLPANLYCTNGSVLVLYLLWGVAVFRLLWTYTGNALTAWLTSAVVMLSLPSTAFAYQYYPEVAAGLAVALVVPFVLLSSDARPAKAAIYGLMAGYLPWLHVRFGLLTILAGLCFSVTRRRAWRAVLWFWIGVAVPLAGMSVYHYHITGNPMPWAMYALTREAEVFGGWWHAMYNLPSFWFDWTGGLLAHAPIYGLALPGVWLCWRRSPAVATSLAFFVLALAVPAARFWSGAGTTPLRLVAAVVSLVALPMADALSRNGRSRWILAIAVVLGVVSIQNGFTYNAHLDKSQPWLLGPTVSGWLSPLLLPNFEVDDRLSRPFIWIWMVATMVLVAGPAAVRRVSAPPSASPAALRSWTGALATVLIVLAALASTVGLSLGYTFRSRFMLSQSEARTQLLTAHQASGGGLRWSARRGRVDMGSLFPNAEGTRLDLRIDPTEGAMRAPVGFRIGLSDPQGAPEWGTARVDFGDGSPVVRIPVVGEARTTHQYAAAGEYRLVVDVMLTSGLRLQEAARVRMGQAVASAAHSEEGAPLVGFDANLVKAPVTMRVERVMVQGSTLSLRGRFVREPRDTRFWLWISTGVGRPRLYDVSSAPDSGDPATFALSVTPHSPVTGDTVVGIVVGVRKDTGRGVAGRTDPIWFPWPAGILTLGSGVVVGPLDRQP